VCYKSEKDAANSKCNYKRGCDVSVSGLADYFEGLVAEIQILLMLIG
jgi:hypothetical protein